MSDVGYMKQVDEICKELGSEYSITSIDGGYDIYKDLGNGIEFEISILEPSRRKFEANIYIWKDKSHTTEDVRSIHSISSLADKLTELTIKYKD